MQSAKGVRAIMEAASLRVNAVVADGSEDVQSDSGKS